MNQVKGNAPLVDMERVIGRLFADPKVVSRLRRDYALKSPASDPASLANELVKSFGQVSELSPTAERSVDNDTVFRAAVRAVASNNRSWSTFLRFESELESQLGGYKATETNAAVLAEELSIPDLRAYLPGQSGTADASAIIKWAALLADVPDYYRALTDLARRLVKTGISEAEVVPAVAAVLGHPTKRMEQLWPPPDRLRSWKTPGMGPILASEFLRNLQWSAFKPDRHIQRLFDLWFDDVVEDYEEEAVDLAAAIGSRSGSVTKFLKFSLVGLAVTPPDRSPTEVDNLVWALGSYVEKRRKESSVSYRVQARRRVARD